ncbi:hypothetical protein Moror_5905 [Moniliophthora roreri MCA 2997]|nr:hypothetical protein Moror_5905 [Moniliophthora roreri MCA 2997]
MTSNPSILTTPLPTPPPPATSHPMPTTIVSPPSMPGASMSAPLSVAAIVPSTLPPASAPATTATSSSMSQGNISWRFIVMLLALEELTELEKKPFEDKAKTINKNRFWDLPSEHIADNQENLPAWISITLKPLIGTGWNQCGNVRFIVHFICNLSNGQTYTEMVMVAGPRSILLRIPKAL